jgi:hypothetical protein
MNGHLHVRLQARVRETKNRYRSYFSIHFYFLTTESIVMVKDRCTDLDGFMFLFLSDHKKYCGLT